MLIEIPTELQKKNVNSAQEAYEVFLWVLTLQDEIDQDKEHMIVLGLKRNNRLKFVDIVSVGTLVGTMVSPREVFRRAITNAASTILIGHNHPSGNHNPSIADIGITRNIKEAGKIIDIQLCDHIIFSWDGFYSFANEGTL